MALMGNVIPDALLHRDLSLKLMKLGYKVLDA